MKVPGLAVVLALQSCFASAIAAENEQAKAGVEWGKSIRGVSAAISLAAKGPELAYGDLVELELRLRNSSSESVTCGLPARVTWRVSNSDGNLSLAYERIEGAPENEFLAVPLAANGETVVEDEHWRPQFLVVADKWCGDPGDYPVPIVKLLPGAHQIAINDFAIKFRGDAAAAQTIGTGLVTVSVGAKGDELQNEKGGDVASDLSYVRIAWGPDSHGIKAGIAMNMSSGKRSTTAVSVFLRNTSDRKRALRPTYTAPLWRAFGFDKAGENFSEPSRAFGSFGFGGTRHIEPSGTLRLVSNKPLPPDAEIVGVRGAVLLGAADEKIVRNGDTYQIVSGMIAIPK